MTISRPLFHKATGRSGMLLLLVLSLAGCAFSPDHALVRRVQELGEGWEDQTIDPQTIQVLQTQQWGKDVIGLVAFQAIRNTGQQQDCLFDYQVTRRGLQWVAGRGGGGCGPVGGDGRAMSIGGGQHRSGQEGSWSSTSGTFYEPTAVAVRVTWEDGQQQDATLVQGHFMVVRSGAHSYSIVEALDEDGTVILSHEHGSPAPGKEDG